MLSRFFAAFLVSFFALGCEDDGNTTSTNQQTVPQHSVEIVNTINCPVSYEEVKHLCQSTGKDFVVSIIPRESDNVSIDEQAVLLKFMVTPCSQQSTFVESVSVRVEVPQGNHDEDMVYSFFHKDDENANIIAFEILDNDTMDGNHPFVSGGFVQPLTQGVGGVVYLPQPAVSDAQVHISIPDTGHIFALVGWFDFPEAKMSRFDISLDNVEAVNNKGRGLSNVVVCNSKKELKQLIVR